jgi:hypothetical protein
MADWTKEKLPLHDRHTWRARPGCKIFVADRGALRFDYPQDWVMIPGENSFHFHDRQPPDDDIHMEVSLIRLPPADWSGLPLRNLITAAIDGDERDIRSRGEVQEARNGDVELAWTESIFIDKNNGGRGAHSRLCLARSENLQPLITMDFWTEDTARAADVWNTVLESLELGMLIEDPSLGSVLH